MTHIIHKLTLSVYAVIILVSLVLILKKGTDYYSTPLEERFFHASHEELKPSGIFGHGFGIIGSFLMLAGVGLYMSRKRVRLFSRIGLLKHWLEFHIFLCTLGPVLVLFHTSFKIGGLVAISFWCMVAVFLSGVIGRFIYLQIPRSIEGRELSLQEIRDLRNDPVVYFKSIHVQEDAVHRAILDLLQKRKLPYPGNAFMRFIRKYWGDKQTARKIGTLLTQTELDRVCRRKMLELVRTDFSLNRKIEMLQSMQELFKYWHVAHLPFALVMLIIMLIHVGVTILFGYQWIFS